MLRPDSVKVPTCFVSPTEPGSAAMQLAVEE